MPFHGGNWLSCLSLPKLEPPVFWLLMKTASYLIQDNTKWKWKQLKFARRKKESNTVLKWRFSRQQLIYLLTLAFNHAASVASTDVCEMLTFITSTCRSSLSEGVTLTAFSIWLSNCFSSESVSTDTNLSSDSSFCREKMAMYMLRQKLPPHSTATKPISTWY